MAHKPLSKTQLSAAIFNGNIQAIEGPLDSGVSVDCFLDDGSTLLLAALSFGKLEIVRMLLDKGADVNLSGKAIGKRPSSGPPILMVLQNPYLTGNPLEALELLIAKNTDCSVTTHDGWTAVALLTKCVGQIGASLVDINALLKNFTDDPHMVPTGAFSPQLDIRLEGIARRLVELGSPIVDRNPDGTGLLSFPESNFLPQFTSFLESQLGDNRDVRGIQNDRVLQVARIISVWGAMPASQKSRVLASNNVDWKKEIVEQEAEALKNIEDISREILDQNISRDSSDTILSLACGGGLDQLVARLLDKGVRITEEAIVSAGGSWNVGIMESLLKRGANIHATNVDGTTALMQSVKECDIKMVEFLLKNGAKVSHRNKRNETTILMCTEQRVRELLEQALRDEPSEREFPTITFRGKPSSKFTWKNYEKKALRMGNGEFLIAAVKTDLRDLSTTFQRIRPTAKTIYPVDATTVIKAKDGFFLLQPKESDWTYLARSPFACRHKKFEELRDEIAQVTQNLSTKGVICAAFDTSCSQVFLSYDTGKLISEVEWETNGDILKSRHESAAPLTHRKEVSRMIEKEGAPFVLVHPINDGIQARVEILEGRPDDFAMIGFCYFEEMR